MAGMGKEQHIDGNPDRQRKNDNRERIATPVCALVRNDAEENGLPHQCAHWFAMTRRRTDCHVAWRLLAMTRRRTDCHIVGAQGTMFRFRWGRSSPVAWFSTGFAPYSMTVSISFPMTIYISFSISISMSITSTSLYGWVKHDRPADRLRHGFWPGPAQGG